MRKSYVLGAIAAIAAIAIGVAIVASALMPPMPATIAISGVEKGKVDVQLIGCSAKYSIDWGSNGVAVTFTLDNGEQCYAIVKDDGYEVDATIAPGTLVTVKAPDQPQCNVHVSTGSVNIHDVAKIINKEKPEPLPIPHIIDK